MPARAHRSGGGGTVAASGGGSSSATGAEAAGEEEVEIRLHAKVNRLDCTSDVGWCRIMGYATAEECVRTYALLCVAFGPGAQLKRSVWFLRKKMVMAYLTPAERVRVFSLVSVAFGRGAAALKRSAKFGKLRGEPPYGPAGAALVLADGSLALDRVEAASIRFPALEDVSVNLSAANSKPIADARRAPILAKLCTFTFMTNLDLSFNYIAVVPDAIGALTNLKYLHLSGNKIATLPASIGRLAALETLYLHCNSLTAVPASISSLTALTTLYLNSNRITTLPDWIGGMTALTTLSLRKNQLAGLPDAIGQLTGLKKLHLNNNRLAAIPESIVALTNLTELLLFQANPQLIRTAQSAAVQAWLQALKGSRLARLRRIIH